MEKLQIGKKIIRLDRVNSTNLFSKKLGAYIKPLHEGTIVLADHQFSGKGRHDKTWESESGKNISMSIVFFPSFLQAQDVFYLSKAIAIGIYDFLSKKGFQKQSIKWPNDIYIGHKKIAGILIENSWKGEHLQESIVGIGLNVNQTEFLNAERGITSLRLEKGKKYDLDEVLKSLVSCIEDTYHLLRQKQFEEIDKQYYEALYGRGKDLRFVFQGEELEGVIQGVNPGGQLVLEVPGKGNLAFDMDQTKFTYEFQKDGE